MSNTDRGGTNELHENDLMGLDGPDPTIRDNPGPSSNRRKEPLFVPVQAGVVRPVVREPPQPASNPPGPPAPIQAPARRPIPQLEPDSQILSEASATHGSDGARSLDDEEEEEDSETPVWKKLVFLGVLLAFMTVAGAAAWKLLNNKGHSGQRHSKTKAVDPVAEVIVQPEAPAQPEPEAVVITTAAGNMEDRLGQLESFGRQTGEWMRGAADRTGDLEKDLDAARGEIRRLQASTDSEALALDRSRFIWGQLWMGLLAAANIIYWVVMSKKEKRRRRQERAHERK